MAAAEQIELSWRVGRIAARAVEIIGDPERALTWLMQPSPRFRGATPISRCGTEAGGREVLDALRRAAAKGAAT